MKKMFKENDIVEILELSQAYCQYTQWFLDNDVDMHYCLRYAYNGLPDSVDEYKVIMSRPDEDEGELVLVEEYLYSYACYLVPAKYLRKIND